MSELTEILKWGGEHPFLFFWVAYLVANVAVAPIKLIMAALPGSAREIEVEEKKDE